MRKTTKKPWYFNCMRDSIKTFLMVLSFILATMFISAIYTILYLNYLTARHEEELKALAKPRLGNTSQFIGEVDTQMLEGAY